MQWLQRFRWLFIVVLIPVVAVLVFRPSKRAELLSTVHTLKVGSDGSVYDIKNFAADFMHVNFMNFKEISEINQGKRRTT